MSKFKEIESDIELEEWAEESTLREEEAINELAEPDDLHYTAFTEWLADDACDHWDSTLAAAFLYEANNDCELAKSINRLAYKYMHRDQAYRDGVNEVLAHLCGYTLETLMKNAGENLLDYGNVSIKQVYAKIANISLAEAKQNIDNEMHFIASIEEEAQS